MTQIRKQIEFWELLHKDVHDTNYTHVSNKAPTRFGPKLGQAIFVLVRHICQNCGVLVIQSLNQTDASVFNNLYCMFCYVFFTFACWTDMTHQHTDYAPWRWPDVGLKRVRSLLFICACSWFYEQFCIFNTMHGPCNIKVCELLLCRLEILILT